MEAITYITILSTGAYLLIIAGMIIAWLRTPTYKPPDAYRPRQSCSLIVPARNEEEHIRSCLQSLCEQEYPADLREIFLIDDFSEDRTPFIAATFAPDVRLLRMRDEAPNARGPAFKKRALAAGISQSENKYIITTDADCISPPGRLRNLLFQIEKKGLHALTAPVLIHRPETFREHFQALDFLSLMGVTALGQATRLIPLANGANFCFTREAFEAVNGYEGIDDIASGDDVLLMKKIRKKFRKKTAFAKNPEAAVFTKAEPTLLAFLRQRLRWAAKTNSHGDRTSQHISKLVWSNSAILFTAFATSLFEPKILPVFYACLAANAIADYLFLHIAAKTFGQTKSLRYFVPAFLMQRLYVLFIGMAASLPFLRISWKNRKIKK